ncbi:hypothetical protein SESBI_12408 [Sesbania bispinosa]|nr:hypothetical protein SESBI_12408 [Sesbania bispinosa]
MIQIPNLQIPDWDTSQSDGGNDTFIGEDFDVPIHPFSTDQFRMFEFKVRNCQRGRSHDWTECPYAHPGEKARRRDPRKHHYSGNPCPEFRKETARKNPALQGRNRLPPASVFLRSHRRTTPSLRHSCLCTNRFFLSSPTSVLNSSPLSVSPPRNSRYGVVPLSTASVGEIVGSMRNVQIEEGIRIQPGEPRWVVCWVSARNAVWMRRRACYGERWNREGTLERESMRSLVGRIP